MKKWQNKQSYKLYREAEKQTHQQPNKVLLKYVHKRSMVNGGEVRKKELKQNMTNT